MRRRGFICRGISRPDPGKWRVAAGPTTPKEEARGELRELVKSYGLLQYPIVLALIIGLPIVLRNDNRRKKLHVVALGLTVACGFLMFYRGYFTSLGW
jgi:hypothetical protein